MLNVRPDGTVEMSAEGVDDWTPAPDKASFPDVSKNYPDEAIEFPVTPKKFPVNSRRELPRKHLI